MTNLVDNVLLIGLGSGTDRDLTEVFSTPDSGSSTLLPGVIQQLAGEMSLLTVAPAKSPISSRHWGPGRSLVGGPLPLRLTQT